MLPLGYARPRNVTMRHTGNLSCSHLQQLMWSPRFRDVTPSGVELSTLQEESGRGNEDTRRGVSDLLLVPQEVLSVRDH
jgi:hypothetical protein